MAIGTTVYVLSSSAYFECSLVAAFSAALPASIVVSATYKAATVSTTAASYIKDRPSFQGTGVWPSGLIIIIIIIPNIIISNIIINIIIINIVIILLLLSILFYYYCQYYYNIIYNNYNYYYYWNYYHYHYHHHQHYHHHHYYYSNDTDNIRSSAIIRTLLVKRGRELATCPHKTKMLRKQSDL